MRWFCLCAGLVLAGALIGIDEVKPRPPEATRSIAREVLEWGPATAGTPLLELQGPTLADVIAKARAIPDLESREQALVQIAVTWADEDSTSAADFLLESVPPGQTQQNAALGIMQRLAVKDMDRATAWAERFPEELRERALAELARISQRQRLVLTQ